MFVDYIHEANTMATNMNLNVSSLDELFFEEIAYQSSETAEELRNTIDQEFYKVMPEGFEAHVPSDILGEMYKNKPIFALVGMLRNCFVELIPTEFSLFVENIDFQPIVWYMKMEAIKAYSAGSPPSTSVVSRSNTAAVSGSPKTKTAKSKPKTVGQERRGTRGTCFHVTPNQIHDLLKLRLI